MDFSSIIPASREKELTIRGAYGATSSAYDWATSHLPEDDRLDERAQKQRRALAARRRSRR